MFRPYMCLVMRKPAFYICENKDADQLRGNLFVFNFFDFNPDPTVRHTFWTLIVGSILQFFQLTLTQSGIQRINSTPNVQTAKKMIYVTTLIECSNRSP